MADPPVLGFAGLLRRLRTEAGLTQEGLATAARVSVRAVSDLERGINLTARKHTARLLADGLGLAGPARETFVAAAMGCAPANGVATAGVAAVRALPRDISRFTGREAELRDLVDAVASGAGHSGGTGIEAIGGMAGIGKTAFAVHAAHQLAAQFPAGQIFLPLHGHTPGQQPASPADALASLLLTAGVPAARIPPDVQARSALWRDRLAGGRWLLVLDDAASSEQVAPLLPGSPDSLVLITSRRHLVALEDARAITLDTLAPGEAAVLLAWLAGRPGLDPRDPSVGQIARLCGYLPLAVAMLARQLHHHPVWTAAGLAADLATARDRLALMTAENVSVAAAFDLSYHDLTHDQQRLFRRLGLHPGLDLDAYTAAALDGTDPATTSSHLEALYGQCLLTEPAQGRYRMHDLIRAHAQALAAREDPPDDRDRAIGRLMDYYQYTAALAEAQLARQTRTRPALPGPGPAAVPDLADSTRALAWTRAERAGLLACLDHVTHIGQHARIVALTAGLAALLRRDGPWADAITRHTTAVQAARCLGDQLGEANALSDLGAVRRMTGGYPGAAEAHEAALGIYRDLGDRLGQANALHDLGVVRRMTDDYPGAAEVHEAALGIYRDLGDRLGQANTLTNLGAVRRQIGDYPGAAEALEAALGIYRDLGRQLGQAHTLHHLGSVRLRTGDYPGAAEALETALGIYRDLGDRLSQASAFNDLGIVRRMTGDYPGAAEALETALGIFRDIGDRSGAAEVLNHVGTLRRARGDLRQAGAYHRQALDMAREIGSRWDEAHALAGLGRCALAAGRIRPARDQLRQALEIFQRIGAAETSAVSAELGALTEGNRPGKGS